MKAKVKTKKHAEHYSFASPPASNGIPDAHSIGPIGGRGDIYLHVKDAATGMRRSVHKSRVKDWQECEDGKALMIRLEPDHYGDEGPAMAGTSSVVVSSPNYDDMAKIMAEHHARGY